jgi:hypothetical protein
MIPGTGAQVILAKAGIEVCPEPGRRVPQARLDAGLRIAGMTLDWNPLR